MRLDALYRHAVDLGLTVEHADLGGRRRGAYVDDTLTIWLNTRLTRAQMTAALAHEIGHAVFNDRCTTPANERRADEYGASLIITVRDYRKAERLVGCHLGALADELEVTPRLIEAWRRWYERQPRRYSLRQSSSRPSDSIAATFLESDVCV